MGGLTLQDLVSAPPDEQLYEMMSSVEMVKLRPEVDQEDVSTLFSKYQITSAPVVDQQNRLIGVLTVGDIISIVRQEAAEDIAKMAGTQASDISENGIKVPIPEPQAAVPVNVGQSEYKVIVTPWTPVSPSSSLSASARTLPLIEPRW